jgi:hypothetical protein
MSDKLLGYTARRDNFQMFEALLEKLGFTPAEWETAQNQMAHLSPRAFIVKCLKRHLHAGVLIMPSLDPVYGDADGFAPEPPIKHRQL